MYPSHTIKTPLFLPVREVRGKNILNSFVYIRAIRGKIIGKRIAGEELQGKAWNLSK